MNITLSYLDLNTYLVVLIRLVAALVFGGLIGIERASSKHDAGLRTHIIVCLGAASAMITSQLIAQQNGSISDIARLGAQVINGIGFLGVGSIVVNRSRIRGLTTAAGLWTTACLGLVIGSGFIELALTMVILMMLTIYVLRPISLKIRASAMTFEVSVSLANRTVTDFVEEFVKQNFDIISIKSSNSEATFTIHTDLRGSTNEFISAIINIRDVIGVEEA